jgi:predicted GH43/DUF377 family glycosyl hydrolase
MMQVFTGILLLYYSKLVHGLYNVSVVDRPSDTTLSFVDGTSTFQQVFNPSFVEASSGTGNRSGLIARTQDCDAVVGGECIFCGGGSDKASIITFSLQLPDGSFSPVDATSKVFGPHDSTDSWGTEDPRIAYSAAYSLYFMFYTAYNGTDIFLSLATSPNPTSAEGGWVRLGPVFPTIPGSKSAALLLDESATSLQDGAKDEPLHHLFWGDSEIRVATSSDPTVWPDPGSVLLSPRPDSFDSQLVEAGPPPLRLASGDFVFFYNSASEGFPTAEGSAYHVGWVVLDGLDPAVVKQRAAAPLLTPTNPAEVGSAPYTCNVPNVVFLEAATALGGDRFQVFFGGADAVIGSAVVAVTQE